MIDFIATDQNDLLSQLNGFKVTTTSGDLVEAEGQPADRLERLGADQKQLRGGLADVPDQHRRPVGSQLLGQDSAEQGDVGRLNPGRGEFPFPERGLHRGDARMGRTRQEPARSRPAVERQTRVGLDTNDVVGAGAGWGKARGERVQRGQRRKLPGLVVSREMGESLPRAQRAEHARRSGASLWKDGGERLGDGRLVVEGDLPEIFDHRGVTE